MTPTSRLEVFLAMIAGREDVEPIMPMTRFEYWLNEIATAKGGNPWKDTDGGGDTRPDVYTAVKVATTRPGSPSSITEKAMMTTIDLGIENFPYPNIDLRIFAETPSQGGEYVIKDRNEDNISFMGAAFKKGAKAIVFTQTDLNRSLVLSPVGTVLNDLSDSNYIRAFFIRSKEEEAPKIKLQLFIYHAADEDPEEAQIMAHVSFDEIKEGGGGMVK